MERRDINPKDWLLAFGINQGVEVTGGERSIGHINGLLRVDPLTDSADWTY